MDNIKIVMDTLDVEEVLLSVTGNYSPDDVRIEYVQTGSDPLIIIISENDWCIDKIYGRKFKNMYFWARCEHISKELPTINWYDEFEEFINGCKSVVLGG